MFNNIPPITRNIIIINVIVFIVTSLMGNQVIGYLAGFYPFSPFFIHGRSSPTCLCMEVSCIFCLIC